MNIGTIRRTIGVILCIEAAFMLPPLLLALADGDAAALRGFAAAIAAVLSECPAASSPARIARSARATAL